MSANQFYLAEEKNTLTIHTESSGIEIVNSLFSR